MGRRRFGGWSRRANRSRAFGGTWGGDAGTRGDDGARTDGGTRGDDGVRIDAGTRGDDGARTDGGTRGGGDAAGPDDESGSTPRDDESSSTPRVGPSAPARSASAGEDDRLAPREHVPEDAVLALEGVDSGYGDLQVLSDLSLHLEAEEIVCLVGPNGAGKSTVLRTAFGLNPPWAGEVTFRGEPVGGADPADLVRLGIGFVPQTDNVFGSLTVEENLRMGGVARRSGLRSTIDALYDRFPILDEKRGEPAKALSGGQRQVLALARALVMEPDVLLVDEPSAGLAPSIVDEVFAHVGTVNEHGAAILMVEQNAREGLGVSDRGYVLDGGTVRFEGPADELLDNPDVSALYLGG